MKTSMNTRFLMICIFILPNCVLAYRKFSASGNDVIVKLINGQVKGKVEITPKSETMFFSFKQIPYAAPPVGKLRFQPPHPVENWDDILDARGDNTKICYQVNGDSILETEDCLYLNVYTPKLPIKNVDEPLIPVMFYIHGGCFMEGTGIHALHGPEFFLDYDVVIVTINYRLGPFGFLYTEDNVMTGNNGLRDQQFALSWVKNNIKLLGGDPTKVTIFGQSAGAASVGYQLLNKASEGLFRAAILESGTPLSPWSFQRNPRKYAFKTAGYIDSSFNDKDNSTELLKFLLQANASDIDQASANVTNGHAFSNFQIIHGFFYAPVLEKGKRNGFITKQMFENLAYGNANEVPIMMGINSEEGISVSALLTNIMPLYDRTPGLLVPNDMNVHEGRKQKAGKEIKNIYCKPGQNFTDNLVGGIKYYSDVTMARPVVVHASMQSSYSTVYAYQFSYDGMMGNVTINIPEVEGVAHSEENGYLWRSSIGQSINTDLSIFPKSDLIIQDRLLELWTNFAKYLNPTPTTDESLDNFKWLPVDADELRIGPYLDINENITLQNGLKSEIVIKWENIYDKYGSHPFDTY